VNIRIATIQTDVEKFAGCGSRHVESVPVKEMDGGRTVWEGVVEVFRLADHPTAKLAYGWKQLNNHVCTVVLGLPPVDSAATAVRAKMAA
jgi:hypothetical protein